MNKLINTIAKLSTKTMWIGIPIVSCIAFYAPKAIAEAEITEIEEFCAESARDDNCKNIESYISLGIWQKNKTKCSLATAWGNEARKCKIVADDNKLTVYVENGEVAESLPNTLKTQAIAISLDEIFAADVSLYNIGGDYDANRPTQRTNENVENAAGTFPELQIGFVPSVDSSLGSGANFLTISA